MVQYTHNTREFLKVTWIGLWINVVLSGLKIWAGIVGNSRAVLADGFHSLSDLVSDVALLIGVRFWSAPADEGHPHGHQRLESLVTLGIALLLAVLSVLLVHDAALSAGIAHVAPGLAVLDLIGTIIVAVFLCAAAWKIAWPALNELTDKGVCAETSARILKVAASVPGVRDVHALRTRFLGAGAQVDLHVMVDGAMSVEEGQHVATAVEDAIMSIGPQVADVLVHIEPWSPAGELHEREHMLRKRRSRI